MIKQQGLVTEVIHHYHSEHESPSSPDAVIPWLIEKYNPKSVVDVGCGLGQWLEAFLRHVPSIDILGIDGAHVPLERLRIDLNKFMVADLSAVDVDVPDIKGRFDIAISLEVAEHIGPERADAYLRFLTSLSDVVLFSAAVPGQTGENHHNEQWPDYWVEKFNGHGFMAFDEIRWKIWDDPTVSWWYRQNMLIFVRATPDRARLSPVKVRSVVHPECFNIISKHFQAEVHAGQRLANKLSAYESGQIGVRAFFGLGVLVLRSRFRGLLSRRKLLKGG